MPQLNNSDPQTILRFSEKILIDDGCWEWSTPGDENHYPKFSLHGKKIDSHRGELEPGMDVCHRCDNRRCCRPDHLFLGSRSVNMIDCFLKNRLKMPRPPQTKLNETQVLQIKQKLREGQSQRSIAVEFGVSRSAIQDIATHKTWKQVA